MPLYYDRFDRLFASLPPNETGIKEVDERIAEIHKLTSEKGEVRKEQSRLRAQLFTLRSEGWDRYVEGMKSGDPSADLPSEQGLEERLRALAIKEDALAEAIWRAERDLYAWGQENRERIIAAAQKLYDESGAEAEIEEAAARLKEAIARQNEARALVLWAEQLGEREKVNYKTPTLLAGERPATDAIDAVVEAAKKRGKRREPQYLGGAKPTSAATAPGQPWEHGAVRVVGGREIDLGTAGADPNPYRIPRP